MKPCIKCGQLKPLSDFRESKSCRDGHRGSCKSCDQQVTKQWKAAQENYGIWSGIKSRCYDPANTSFKNYGGRGIGMCDSWRESFEAFKRDMGTRPSPEHSIDRIDNDGPYSPENCRWSTKKKQGNNRRDNVVVELNGVKRTVAEWCRELGKDPRVVNMRYKAYGWSIEDAITRPIRSKRRDSVKET